MIVYQVTGLFFKGRKRYIKRRVSDGMINFINVEDKVTGGRI
jgi:hypothetical protein